MSTPFAYHLWLSMVLGEVMVDISVGKRFCFVQTSVTLNAAFGASKTVKLSNLLILHQFFDVTSSSIFLTPLPFRKLLNIESVEAVAPFIFHSY